ncbi:MAG: YraN family protein [Arenimonas sp.]|jgi:putative endonuclease
MSNNPPIDRKSLGADAEDAAHAFLVANGLTLSARNVRYPFGEIDLIMCDGATLVFVEVRFRRSSNFGGAAVSVDARKRRKIARAAQAWLSSHRQFSNAACRFDVVAVTPASTGLQCEWIRSAFTLDDLW